MILIPIPVVVVLFICVYLFLGPDNMDNLRKIAEQLSKQTPGATTAQVDDDDDDVPELVPGQTFEATANEGKSA